VLLSDAEAKQAALAAYVAALKVALASGALGKTVDIGVSQGLGDVGGVPDELPVGAFNNKSVPAAIKLYLAAVKTKRSTAQIAAALKDGGVESLSRNFQEVVRSALGKLKNDGELARFPDGGWKLTEQIPQALRNRLDEGQKKPKPKAKAKSKKKPAASAKPESKPAVPSVPPHPEAKADPVAPPSTDSAMQPRILAYFAAHAGEPLTGKEVAEALGLRSQTVGMLCSILAKTGPLQRSANGKFLKPQGLAKAS
jgi:hypothetical protein